MGLWWLCDKPFREREQLELEIAQRRMELVRAVIHAQNDYQEALGGKRSVKAWW
jgi:hypothetical protein